MSKKLSDARYEQIKKEVVFMFEECDIHNYPIDCFEIARKLHYILVPYSSLEDKALAAAYAEDPDGFSRVEEDAMTGMFQYVIYYNDVNVKYERIRWTIFHEIGHCYLGHHDNAEGLVETEEAEANFFAKYAVAPPPLVYKTGCHDLFDVANSFQLTWEAAQNSYNYCRTWLEYGPSTYLSYEVQLLGMFHLSVA